MKAYKKGSNTKLSANFRAREFDCQGTGCCSETPIDEKLVLYLQKIRDHFGKPVVLTAYRCPIHNAKVANAAPRSYHTLGQAADFHIDGVKPAQIAKYAESIGVLGIGLYDTFVHIDTRTAKSFWYSHAQQRRTTFGGTPQKTTSTKGDYTMEMKNLKKGMTGENVRALQILLTGRGYSCNPDGNFGPKTESLVKQYQKAKGLGADGVAGKKTMAKLMGLS